MSHSPSPQWQTGYSNAQFSTPATCADRANSFERRVRIRNVIEYVVGAFAVLLFGALTIGALFKDEKLISLASVLIVIGVLAVLWNLRRRASNLERRPEDACLTHLRRQYQRQYKALSAVPRWYIGPLIPGVALFYALVTSRVAEVAGWSVAIEGIVGPAAITFGLFTAIAAVNWIAARTLKRKIDALDRLA